MFNLFERMMAFRYLRAKKAESFVSVIAGFSFLGIMLGVATLIIVMSVMNGFRQELFSRILGLNGHINVTAVSGPLYDYDFILEQVRSADGVYSAAPMIESQALLSVGGVSSGIIVRGIEPDNFARRDILNESVRAGSIADFGEGGIAIGSVLADRLGLKIGDQILLTSPKVRSTPFGTMPRQRRFEVGLVFDVGMYEYNSGFVFLPLTKAQQFFQFEDGVSVIEVFLQNPRNLDAVRAELERILQNQANIYDWRDSNASFYNALKTERNVMFLILTLIILVAAFNIISSMIMLVKDKHHDIAILRTMGASSASIMRVFILAGAAIGIIGTLFGAILGISFAMNIETIRQFLEGLTGAELFADEIYFLSRLPAEIDWGEVWSVLVMAFGLSIAATLYPAWRAARLDPVEALRYE